VLPGRRETGDDGTKYDKIFQNYDRIIRGETAKACAAPQSLSSIRKKGNHTGSTKLACNFMSQDRAHVSISHSRSNLRFPGAARLTPACDRCYPGAQSSKLCVTSHELNPCVHTPGRSPFAGCTRYWPARRCAKIPHLIATLHRADSIV
jgi:hypothetical protein